MEDDVRRRLVYGVISLVLSLIATRLAIYITDRILGPENKELTA